MFAYIIRSEYVELFCAFSILLANHVASLKFCPVVPSGFIVFLQRTDVCCISVTSESKVEYNSKNVRLHRHPNCLKFHDNFAIHRCMCVDDLFRKLSPVDNLINAFCGNRHRLMCMSLPHSEPLRFR